MDVKFLEQFKSLIITKHTKKKKTLFKDLIEIPLKF